MKQEILKLSQGPIKLKSTRTWRTYIGGKLIDTWQGNRNGKDGEFPEEWIASVVNARNPGREDILDEGLSKLNLEDGKEYTLKELIEAEPVAFLGHRHVESFGANLGVLVKILDSAERLTIQVHPDNRTAKELFNSIFGKTEAWYILGGREINGEKPYIYLGFREGITREKWQELFQSQDIEEMLNSLNKFYVSPGEVYLIEGGVPHAIGSGCFLAEIQEPTDYTIRVERTTPSGRKVSDLSCHQGIGFDKMFDCFHYEGCSREEVLRKWNLKPSIIKEGIEGRESALITFNDTRKFAMNSIEVNTEIKLDNEGMFSVLIILSGSGRLSWKGGTIEVRQGEQVFLPVGVQELECINSSNELLTLIRCFPPAL